jgi:hypothetical protein
VSQLTPEQRSRQSIADRLGREFVTRIDGRIAIILRPVPNETEDATVARLADIVRALGSIGSSEVAS